jgi:cellulose synthase operon protein C
MTCRPDLRFHLLACAALLLSAAAAAVPTTDALREAAVALERGDGIAAEVAARRALDEGVERHEVTALLGEAELLQGELGDARRWLAAGEFSGPTRERGFHALGRLEMAEGDLAAAAEAFDRALDGGRGSARLWADIGRLRYRAGQHDLALEAAAKAVAIDPSEPRALEFQAQLTRDSRGLVAALPWFERALGQAPDDIGLLGEYAATLGEAGRNKEMLRVARRMVELDPRHPRAYYLQAVLAARANHDDLARRLLARTNGAYDDIPAGELLAGILELRTGNAALAIDRFDALARRQPENAAAQQLLGRALLSHGEANEVVGRFRAAADRPGASPYLLALVGRAYEQMDERADAARYLDRAAHAGPSAIGVLPVALDQLDDLLGAGSSVAQVRQLLAQGRNGEAVALAGQARERYQGSIDVEILAGDVALLSGDPASALASYRRAAIVRRDFGLVEKMVVAEQRLGREEAATALLSDYLAQNPCSAPASEMLGRMMARRGDDRRAGLLLAHARSIAGREVAEPENSAVAMTMARLARAAGKSSSDRTLARR